MRLAYIIEKLSGIGGMERILIDKINYLAEHTANELVLVLIWHDKNDIAYPLNNKVKVVRLNVPNIPKLLSPKLLALYRFNKVIKRIAPDITVYVWTAAAFIAAHTSWKGKSIFESHQPLSTMKHKRIIKSASKNVDVTVCLTHGDALEFKGIAKSTEIIPNFTNFPKDATSDCKAKNVIFVGRDSKEKDIPRLKRLWNIVKEEHKDWTLTFHHNTKDIVRAYLNGSILVMTSKFEGFSIVLIEAMSCGIPSVAFDCPYGPRDIINNGKTGFLIPYDDDQMFIDKLSLLMANEDIRIKMGKEAKLASSYYQPAPIMSQWLKLFSRLKS